MEIICASGTMSRQTHINTHTHTHILSVALAPLLRQSLQGFVLLALIVLADQSEKHALKPIISSEGNVLVSGGERGWIVHTAACLKRGSLRSIHDCEQHSPEMNEKIN